MPRKKEPASVTEQGIFPTRLRQLMEERKTTQKVLAEAVGVRPQTISLYTTGQSYPDVNGLRKIAMFYKVSADWLLGLTEHQATRPDVKAICEYLEIQEYNLPFLRGFFHHDPEHANCLFENPYFQSEGWSKRAIDRELAKQAAEFERQVQAGEVVSRVEQAQIDRQQALERAKIKTVKQYGESVFMPAKAVTISENARNAYQGNLDHWVYPALGELKLPEVTSAEVSALLLSMQAAGKSQATCIKVYTVLKSLFKMAYMADLIDRNPMDKVERPKPRKDELKKPAEAESYTAGELKYILDCLQNEPLKWQAFMSLLIDTGLRRGEACGLKWEYVDLDAGRNTVAGNLCYTPAKGVYLDTPKSGKTRTVDIAPGVVTLLRKLRQEQAAKGLSHFVFNQESSPEPMHPQTPTRYMKKFAQRYDIEGLHPHKLRHPYVKPKNTFFLTFLGEKQNEQTLT